MCVDESNVNNEYQCVKCNKLVARFTLAQGTFEKGAKKSNAICSIDTASFFDSLIFSLETKLFEQATVKDEEGIRKRNQDVALEVESLFPSQKMVKFESGLLPVDFDLADLYLEKSNQVEFRVKSGNLWLSMLAAMAILCVFLLLFMILYAYFWMEFTAGRFQIFLLALLVDPLIRVLAFLFKTSFIKANISSSTCPYVCRPSRRRG